MSRKPGILITLADDRNAIVYNAQPLFKEKGKIILHLLDEDLKPLLDENKKPKIIIKDIDAYNQERKGAKLIGYVD